MVQQTFAVCKIAVLEAYVAGGNLSLGSGFKLE